MSRATDPTAWMWAHAVDLIEQAEHMHRQFFRLATSTRSQALWEPPVDVFEDDGEVFIVVALPGVLEEHVQVSSEPGELVVRAERPVPFAGSRQVIRQLEIPYGYFERRIPLPQARMEFVARELTHGCLILRLRKARQGTP
jgi:HSP20 family molecular chaperone IbpA